MWAVVVVLAFLAAALSVPVPVFGASEEAVTGLVLASDSPGTLTASWGVPGQVPVGYRVNWAKSSGGFPSWRVGEGNGNFYPTTNSYTISGLEQGVEYKVQWARYRDSQNRITGLTPWSDLVRLVVGVEPQNSPATGAPTVTGTARVGETLTVDTSGIADADGLTNVLFGYQWIRSDGSDDSDILGATGGSYTLVADDEEDVPVAVDFRGGGPGFGG